MAAPLYLTKGELRRKLLIRLGYGGLGAGAGLFVPMADELLEEAQAILFQLFTDEKGVRTWDLTTGVNQRWYDIPDTCDIDRICGMWVLEGGDYWRPLTRGIDHRHDSHYDDLSDYPYNYDIRYNPSTAKTQIEVWPKPDAAYPMQVEGPMQVGAFVDDGDRASFDTHLILLYATAHGKANKGANGAKEAMDAWQVFLKNHRANQHGTRRYIRRNPNKPQPEVRARPRVV